MVQNRSKTNNLIKIVSKINRVRDRVTRKNRVYRVRVRVCVPEPETRYFSGAIVC